MNLNQLQYFVTLAQLEHYTNAAEQLRITQPTLSLAIRSLEEEMGTKLFEKKGRNVVLTKYGRFFLGYVEEALQILENGVKKTKVMTGQTTGVIDIAYIYTLGSEFVPQLVGDFIRSNEELQVKFNFTVGNTLQNLKGLKEERFDVAFCSRIEEEEDIEFIPVGREKLVVVVPKGHPLSEKGMVELNDVAKYPQIFFTPNSGLRPVIDEMFKREKLSPKIAYEIEEDSFMAGVVAQNFGIAVMPNIPILQQLPVEILKLHNPGRPRYIYLAQRKDKYVTPVVKKFVEFVRKNTLL
jgi:DNA-binding transcriptional LysR family regulator